MSILAVDSIKPRATGVAVTVTGDLDVTGTLGVTGDISYDEVTGRNINITGIATVNTFGASGIATVGILTAYNNVNVAGITTIDASGVNITGVVTATSFSGDGSGLSGVESWNQQDTWLYGG